jgi:hypothetical protein
LTWLPCWLAPHISAARTPMKFGLLLCAAPLVFIGRRSVLCLPRFLLRFSAQAPSSAPAWFLLLVLHCFSQGRGRFTEPASVAVARARLRSRSLLAGTVHARVSSRLHLLCCCFVLRWACAGVNLVLVDLVFDLLSAPDPQSRQRLLLIRSLLELVWDLMVASWFAWIVFDEMLVRL